MPLSLQPFHHEADCLQCRRAGELRLWSLVTEGLGTLFTFAVVFTLLYLLYGLVWKG